MNSKILLVAVVIVGCCALEALAKFGVPDAGFDLNIDLHTIDPKNEAAAQRKFDQFKFLYGKVYANKEEEKRRYEIFKKNLKPAIENETYNLDEFSDLTEEEIKKQTPGKSKP